MIIPEQTRHREAEESDLAVTVDRRDYADIERFIDTIRENEELLKISKVKDNCTFIYQMIPHLDEARNGDEPFEKELSYLIEVVENHGLPKQGHLEGHGDRLMAKYNNGYSILLSDPIVKECFEEARDHRSGKKHSERYEACLIHLHVAATEYDKGKKQEPQETEAA